MSIRPPRCLAARPARSRARPRRGLTRFAAPWAPNCPNQLACGRSRRAGRDLTVGRRPIMDDLVRNDDALHDLLELSIGEPPQTSVSIAMARSRGQRRRRWRRRYAPGLAAVAAAAAIVLVAVGLPFAARAGHSAHGHVATAAGQLVARPPSRFSLSTPYASFGWLPAGFSATGSKVLGDPDDQSAQGESIWASNQQPDGKTLNL